MDKGIKIAIKKAAQEAVFDALHIPPEKRKLLTKPYYKRTEGLLMAYNKIKRFYEHPEEYQFFPVEHSHDIIMAPPKGTIYQDKADLVEAHVERRKRSFVKTMTAFFCIRAAILSEMNRPEFIAVAMYYLNQDEYGNDRGDNAPRLTWEEISERLENVGIYASARALSGWRNKIVREMTVLIFGVDGALSLSVGSPRDDLDAETDLQEGGPDDEEQEEAARADRTAQGD